MGKRARKTRVRNYKPTTENTLLVTHGYGQDLTEMPCKVDSKVGRTIDDMLGEFAKCQEHEIDRIGKGVKRVFVMLGVCDLAKNSVRRLKTLAVDLSNALWEYHREIVWICVQNTPELRRFEAKRIAFNAFLKQQFFCYELPTFSRCMFGESNSLTSKGSRVMQGCLSKRIATKNAKQAHKKCVTGMQSFWKGGWATNFHKQSFVAEGVRYCSMEQYYQYQKCLFAMDRRSANKVLKATSNDEMKQYGREAKMDDALLREWDSEERLTVMARGLKAKFKAPNLRRKLLCTGSCFLVEASPIDEFWGAGLASCSPYLNTFVEAKDASRNHLGQLLMQLRDQITGTSSYDLYY